MCAAVGITHEDIARVIVTGGIDGIVLTKLDGTAKGGAIFGIKRKLDLPVKVVGVGEQLDDLEPFDPDAYVEALFAE